MLASQMALAVSDNLTKQPAVKQPVQVLAVTGGKGGVGKTNVSVNLALALGNKGRKVLLLDGDLGLANIDVLCGIKPAGTLSDVITDGKGLDEILVRLNDHVSILPASSGAAAMTGMTLPEYGGLIRAFNDLKSPLDTLVVDTAAGINTQVTAFCRAAREVVIVVCDEPTSIADATATMRVLCSDCQIKRFNVVVNKARSAQHGNDLFEKLLQVAETNIDVGLNYLGAIPDDQHLLRSVWEQRPVVMLYPDSASAQAFGQLASVINGWPEPTHPIGHLEFFVERLVSYGTSAR